MVDPCEGLDLQTPVDATAAIDDRDVALVQKTWARAAGLGAETVGKVLFMQILSIAPEAIDLFPFKDFPQDRLYKVGSPLVEHGAKVVNTLNVGIGMLNDLPALVPVLRAALPGLFPSAQKEHYGVVGQAALNSLAIALGGYWTESVKNAWLKIWSTIVSVMFPEGESGAAKSGEEALATETVQAADAAKSREDAQGKTAAATKTAQKAAKPAASKGPESKDFSGKWILDRIDGDMDRFLKAKGATAEILKMAKKVGYGVGLDTLEIKVSDDSFYIKSKAVGESEQTLAIGAGPQDGKQWAFGSDIKITLAWEGVKLTLHCRGKSVAETEHLKYYLEDNVLIQEITFKQLIVKRCFKRQ